MRAARSRLTCAADCRRRQRGARGRLHGGGAGACPLRHTAGARRRRGRQRRAGVGCASCVVAARLGCVMARLGRVTPRACHARRLLAPFSQVPAAPHRIALCSSHCQPNDESRTRHSPRTPPSAVTSIRPGSLQQRSARMRPSLGRTLRFFTASALLSRGVPFLLNVAVARRLTPAELGVPTVHFALVRTGALAGAACRC